MSQGFTRRPINITTLNDLTDVDITVPAKGDMMVFDGTSWVDLTVGANDTVMTADTAQTAGVKWAVTPNALDDLTDVVITGAAKGDMVAYTGTSWVDLTVGADDTVMTADAAETAGVKWVAPPDPPGTFVDDANGSSTTTGYTTLGDGGSWNFDAEIRVIIDTRTTALVLFKADLSNSVAAGFTVLSYSVSGATTVTADDAHSIFYESSVADDRIYFGGFDFRTGLTAGSNTFTLNGRVTANTGTIRRPEITVIPY